jgi:hypothetical protein
MHIPDRNLRIVMQGRQGSLCSDAFRISGVLQEQAIQDMPYLCKGGQRVSTTSQTLAATGYQNRLIEGEGFEE